MTPYDKEEISFDDWDEIQNPRPEECDFDRVVEAAISRRGFLGGVLAFGSFAALGGTMTSTDAMAAANRFAFDQIPTNGADDITLPPGYKMDVLVRWGDPILPGGVEFDHATRGTSESQALALATTTTAWMCSLTRTSCCWS